MNIEKIEKKLKANYRCGNPSNFGSGGFILSGGSIIPLTSHQRVCYDLGWKMPEVLEAGLCWFTSHHADQTPTIFFRYHTLTPEQKTTVRKVLAAEDYCTVNIEKTTVDRVHPIRSIQF